MSDISSAPKMSESTFGPPAPRMDANSPKMATDHPMDEFDRWRENCFAIIDENGLVISLSGSEKDRWIEWMKKTLSAGNHIIAQDDVKGFHISTLFLGTNLNTSGTGPPLWFVTLVFRKSAYGKIAAEVRSETLRYSTVADALAGHAVVCEKVRSAEIGE
jgi:hypothetical protein